MAKLCPMVNDRVVYLTCNECDDKICDKINTELYYINDGYGVIGVGFKCHSCGKENMFVHGDVYEHVCKFCESMNYMKVLTDY